MLSLAKPETSMEDAPRVTLRSLSQKTGKGISPFCFLSLT